MRLTSSQHQAPPPSRRRILAGALAVTAACSFLFAADAGGDLRGDLAAGAAQLGGLSPGASDAEVRTALRLALAGRTISVDAKSFPAAVAVTVHDIDRSHCVTAERRARRLEGKVVVELVGYRSAADCGAGNDMTWRFMP